MPKLVLLLSKRHKQYKRAYNTEVLSKQYTWVDETKTGLVPAIMRSDNNLKARFLKCQQKTKNTHTDRLLVDKKMQISYVLNLTTTIPDNSTLDSKFHIQRPRH